MNKDITDINYQLGKRIRYLRQQKKLSQEELSLNCGINTKYLSDIERGERNPTLKIIEKIADGLGIRLSELFLGLGTTHGINKKNF